MDATPAPTHHPLLPSSASSASATTPNPTLAYTLPAVRLMKEDVLFCVDVDAETQVEMKATGTKRPVTRLDAIKQGLILFAHSKLAMNADHRFAFSVLTQSFDRIYKAFTNELPSIMKAVQVISHGSASNNTADLTSLFRVANQEAIRSRAEGRLLRVVLIYCRSSLQPQHRWPVSEKLFTMDVIYIHDKPGPENCPQKVYDALVDAVEHVSEYEGYIFETGQALARVLFRYMCILLCHPQQRCPQDDLDIPKSIAKKTHGVGEGPSNDEAVLPPTQVKVESMH